MESKNHETISMNFSYSFTKIVAVAVFALLSCFLTGCKDKATCPDDFMKKPAKIVSITGPNTLTVGERAAINIGVENEQGICIIAVKADAENTGLDTITIDAELQYIAAGEKQCDCLNDSLIYTLIYFTPTTSGSYFFQVQKKLDSNVNPNDSATSFEINVP